MTLMVKLFAIFLLHRDLCPNVGCRLITFGCLVCQGSIYVFRWMKAIYEAHLKLMSAAATLKILVS